MHHNSSFFLIRLEISFRCWGVNPVGVDLHASIVDISVNEPSMLQYLTHYWNEPCSVKRGFNALANGIIPCQLAQSAQADIGRNFLPLDDFLPAEGPVLPHNSVGCYWPFPKRQILDSSKLKDFADVNFRFDENCRKFSKRIENTVGNGEIARYEQFLLFPLCFQKMCTADT